MRLLGRAIVTAIVAAGAFVLGGCGGFVSTLHSPPAPNLAVHYHLPHHLPKYPAGLSFRFAMAHDVIHERYPRHGPAYLRERERRRWQVLRERVTPTNLWEIFQVSGKVNVNALWGGDSKYTFSGVVNTTNKYIDLKIK